MSYIDDLKHCARVIRDFCSENYDNEESCPFFRGYKEEDGVKLVICELNKGECSPCNWEVK